MVSKSAFWLLLSLFALLPFICSATEDDAAKFDLAATDIQAIAWQDGAVWIQLNPSAAFRFQETTEQSYGRLLVINLDGITIFSTRMHAAVASGVIHIDKPSPDLRSRLERFPREN